MSHDQRPGKMRVVGNAGAAPGAPVPQRRRNDPGRIAAEAAEAAASAAAAKAAGTASTGLPMIGILLFLLGCATGGVILTLLGVFA